MATFHIAIYGSIGIRRGTCGECGGRSLVIKDKTACCDFPVSGSPSGFVQEAAPIEKRRSPSRAHKRKQLDRQGGRCLYCDLEIGSYVTRNGDLIKLMLAWDHVVPFSYSRDNGNQNFVAACHICNGIKSDLMFGDLDEAKAYVTSRRVAKGYL